MGNRTSKISAMDNGTMVESFKFLNYCQLATNSLVSKRYRNLICTHRHKLALLHVDSIYMEEHTFDLSAVVQIFDKVLSPEEYNEWLARNHYSEEVQTESQIAEMESTQYERKFYQLWAFADYKDPKSLSFGSTSIFYARAEFNNENWPLFQHFIRLITDPFVYIRCLEMGPPKEVLNLLTGAISTDHKRLRCIEFRLNLRDNMQKFVSWIKDHVLCNELRIYDYTNSKYDETLLDFFMTGANCTSEICFGNYDFSKVVIDFVRKFLGLKNRDEYQVVESIRGNDENRKVVVELKRNFAEFIAEEEQFEEESDTRQIIGLINNNIEKKLTLNIKKFCPVFRSPFSMKISNL